MVGLVDLVIVVPVLSLALLAGHVADTFDRRRVLICSLSLTTCASLGLAFVSYYQALSWRCFVACS